MEIRINNELKGIELVFDSKPANSILTAINGAGFRWHNVKKLWYAKQTPERDAIIKMLFSEDVTLAPVAEAVKAVKRSQVAPLFDRVHSEIMEHQKHLDTKTIAAETRKHLKVMFPEMKISCRIGSGGWAAHNEVNVLIVSGPYAKDGAYMDAIKDYIKSWLWSYNYDNSDSMTDYFDRGFYENVSTWNYEEIEPSDAIKADMSDFDAKTEKARQEAEEKAHADFLAYQAERAEAEKLAEIRRAEEAKKHEEIVSHVQVVDIAEEEKRILIFNGICSHGKECTLAEVAEDGTPKEETAVIKREIYFTNETIYNNFCEMLLHDFDFLTGCGGTGTLDQRVNNDNFNYLNQRQRDAVQWVLWDCVAVYLNDELKLVSDPEGYSYSRYTNIVKSVISNKLLSKAEAEEETETRDAFNMPEPIAKQAESIAEGDNVTIISLSGWTLCTSSINATITGTTIRDYAQYRNALYLDYIKTGCRKTERNIFHDNNSVLIYRGAVPPVPKSILETKLSDNVVALNHCGAGAHDFMIATYKYYKSLGLDPVVNTLQF